MMFLLTSLSFIGPTIKLNHTSILRKNTQKFSYLLYITLKVTVNNPNTNGQTCEDVLGQNIIIINNKT